jgi:photosystem II stability/assembly factor-like uncharacterized protein
MSAVRQPFAYAVAVLLASQAAALAQPARPARGPAAVAAPDPADAVRARVLEGLKFRSIGPAAMGGRIDDVAVVESDASTVYVATASGGLWKTTNSGTTWTPLFDREAVSTIGDVTLAPSDPSIVWVGTGEPNNRQSSSWGNGVYRSTDAGLTWRHMGLRDTHHIGRIVVHPANPAIVYVAALGRLWGASEERGLYKTTNGGETWTRVLGISADTGVVDVVMDPRSPDTLYAAAYQRRRAAFGFAGSGPEGGIHKTTDGGATWTKLERGLPWDTASPRGGAPRAGGGAPSAPGVEGAAPSSPRQEIGRIGLAIYRSNPSILYALVEHEAGGIFRSDDRGETWRRMSDTNPRPMYYSKVHVDPTNDLRVWVLGASMYFSEDGGKTFRSDLARRAHGDFHAMWIDPANPARMITGSDGGLYWSHDRGLTWDYVANVALGQFYEIGLDNSRPFRICGGLQDNNTWCGPSASLNPRGVSNGDWVVVGGGDGFYAQIDPEDPDTVYGESQDGNLYRRDLRTGQSRSIRPQPAEGGAPYRFQWNSPIVISGFDHRTIYYGGNVVFRSRDRGDSWEVISPDLTTGADRNALPIMGRVPDARTRSRHDGVRHWPAITTLAESPLDAGVLWAGTDDGRLHVTRDGGATWTDVFGRVPGVPAGTYVSRVVASRHQAGTAYATFDGHRANDFGIYVYATPDFGATWTRITGGLPEDNGVINVIREDPRQPDLLFAGGEYGAFVSFTRGRTWLPLRGNLPRVPVDDIAIHARDNDLVLATHGRSIWILDDLAPLQELASGAPREGLHVFPVRPAIQWSTWSSTGTTGDKAFFGENPPYGALIRYHVGRAGAGGPAKIEVRHASGALVRELTGPAEPGLNQAVWDTRAESPVPPARGETPGGGGFFGQAQGARVDPGVYAVTVTVGEQKAPASVEVLDDPRITFPAADRAQRRAALDRLAPAVRSATVASRTITQLRTTLVAEMDGWKKPGAAQVPAEVQSQAAALLARIDEAYPTFGTPPSEQRGLGDAGPPLVERPAPLPMRLRALYGTLAETSAAPTAGQLRDVEILTARATEASALVTRLAGEDLAALNAAINQAGVPRIVLPPGAGGDPPR